MTRSHVCLGGIFAALSLLSEFAAAAEKDGLRVEIVPQTGENRTKRSNFAAGYAEVDKDMSLKATVKNISMRNMPESTIDYIILVIRWDGTEIEKYERYSGNAKVPALRPSDQVEVAVGQYHIGGHRHGSSTRHEDKLAGWRVVVTQDGKQIQFQNPANFEAMNKAAQPALDTSAVKPANP